MEEKLAIDGKIIGTTAEHVEYSKQGWSKATNAKAALDDLQDRLSKVEEGGTPTPIESAADVPYSKQGWSGVANVKQALDDVHDRLETEGGGTTGPVVYAYGDSISADGVGIVQGSGFAKSGSSHANWPRVFARLVNARKFVNYAVSGNKSSMAFSIANNLSDADLVVMMIGVNDLATELAAAKALDATFSQDIGELIESVYGVANIWQGDSSFPQAITSSYLGRVAVAVRRIFSSATNTKLILVTPMYCGMDESIPATDDSNNLGRWNKRLLMNMRSGLKRMADYINEEKFDGDERIIYVDSYKAGIYEDNRDDYFVTGSYLHPKMQGSIHIAEYVYRKAILKEPDKYIDMPKIRIDGNFDENTGRIVFSCAPGETVTNTFIVNGENCGDLSIKYYYNNIDRQYFSFTERIQCDEAYNVVNKEFSISFTAPANATSDFAFNPTTAFNVCFIVNRTEGEYPRKEFGMLLPVKAEIVTG